MSEYFCGWYFKCRAKQRTIAVIPAFHEADGSRSCSVQFITDEGAWNVPFSCQTFHKKKDGLSVRIGGNVFCERGFKLRLRTVGLCADGCVRFGAFTTIRYDIMGPFACLPFMECRHSVYSMTHTVRGAVTVNGETYRFEDGEGYAEGDRGRSFPKVYAWTQCSFDGGSLMLSVADIPIGPVHFTGIIGVIMLHGREYRLATYLGARAVKIGGGELVVRQGKNMFRAKLLEKQGRSQGHPLNAPKAGAMTRVIREHPACRARYGFWREGRPVFEFESANASFEYEYPF